MEKNIPEKMLAWQLHGKGMDKLGREDGLPEEIPVPGMGKDELLVRIDAIGLCFSDIKLINAGEDHPRVLEKDFSSHPVIPGHEAVMTVLDVGEGEASTYSPGRRFIIQADIYYKGAGLAYGYALNGGMAQYSAIGKEILHGDECCYLLSLRDGIPSAAAALIEPWTCVIASTMIDYRSAPKPRGRVLIAGSGGEERFFEPGASLMGADPESVTVSGFAPGVADRYRDFFSGSEIYIEDDVPENSSFDDIFICEIRDMESATAISKLGAKNAVCNFLGDFTDEDWPLDIGAIHYNRWYFQGADSRCLSDAYSLAPRSKFRAGGSCWLPGGAGAMGQMHTQLVVESPDGPGRVLVTDMDQDRLDRLEKLLEPAAGKRGVELAFLNPGSFDSEKEFNEKVAEFAEPSGGFDDIIMLVPVPALASSCAPFLREEGVMNIFAGIPAGREAELNIRRIVKDGVRYIGSSGSLTRHLKHTLKMVEEGALNPAASLAAVGGMNVLKKGLESLVEARFPGKTVIFPHCPELPLVPVEKLPRIIPGIESTFDSNGLYTLETEKMIFDKYGSR